MVGTKMGHRQDSLCLSHIWRTIVFIQPGVQEMSIINCASKVSVDQY